MENEELDDNIVVLNDEEGNEVQFEFLDLVELDDEEYVVLLPVTEEGEEEEGEVVILKLEDTDEDSEEESYVGVEDEEILNIKKIEIIKILSNLKYKYSNIYIYYKNINYKYNSLLKMNSIINSKKNIVLPNYKYNLYKLQYNNQNISYKTTNANFNKLNFNNKNLKKKRKTFANKRFSKLNRYYSNLKYFKTIRFILYNICYNKSFLNKVSASNLINIIYYELDKLDNASKSYNFLFYNIFNLIRTQLLIYLKDNNCKIKGIRIQVKGRYFLTKRKRIFIFNLGNLNVNKINYNKDYYCLHLVKSTGTSSIKIWLSYKN